MIHFVENLSVMPITIEGIRTATFTNGQTSLCGKFINVKKRNDFATKVNGLGMVTCQNCIDKYIEQISKPKLCESCEKILETKDWNHMDCRDFKMVCFDCREKGEHLK